MPTEQRGAVPPDLMRETQPKKVEFDWEHGEIPEAEVRFTTSRGGGPGGQGVNTTDSRVELRWTIGVSPSLSEPQKEALRQHTKEHARKTILEDSDELKFVCVSERSQLQNRVQALSVLQSKLTQRLLEERASKIDELKGQWVGGAQLSPF
jgi:protein subunit release factor B